MSFYPHSPLPQNQPEDKAAGYTGLQKAVAVGSVGLFMAAATLYVSAIYSSDTRKMAGRSIADEVARGVTVLGPHRIHSSRLVDARRPIIDFTVSKIDVTEGEKYNRVCVELDTYTIGEKIFSFAPVCTTVKAKFGKQARTKAGFAPG